MKFYILCLNILLVSCVSLPFGASHEDHIDTFGKSVIDSYIEDELRGLPPPGGISTWNRSWKMQIDALTQAGSERDRAHVRHIIEGRQRAGLPELSL